MEHVVYRVVYKPAALMTSKGLEGIEATRRIDNDMKVRKARFVKFGGVEMLHVRHVRFFDTIKEPLEIL